MAYTKTVWVNGGAPAVSAVNLNNIENGIFNSIQQDGSTKMSGQFAVIQGSATTPSIAYFGDTNTGIYWSSADELGFTEGGKGFTWDEIKMSISMGAML